MQDTFFTIASILLAFLLGYRRGSLAGRSVEYKYCVAYYNAVFKRMYGKSPGRAPIAPGPQRDVTETNT